MVKRPPRSQSQCKYGGLVNRAAPLLFGVVLAFLLTSPCLAADWGESPLTGKPQGFEKDCSPPVGDFSRKQEETGFKAYPFTMPLQLDGNYSPLKMMKFPPDFAKPGEQLPLDAAFYKWPKLIEYRKAWSDWHKAVSEAIRRRFNQAAQKSLKVDLPLRCDVGYTILSDGGISDVKVLRPSANATYDALLVKAIKSIEHDPVVTFPTGSKRRAIEKTSSFSWNYHANTIYSGHHVGNFEEEPHHYFGPKPEAK